jgi:hypothetical protein
MKQEAAGLVAWIVTMGAAHGLGCASSSHPGESSGGFDAGQAAATTYFETVVSLQIACTATSCLCLGRVLSPDSAGQVPCAIFFLLASGDTCAAHGLSPAAADVAASVESFEDVPSSQAICVLPQLPASDWVNGSCAGSSDAGWCYVTGAAAETCPQVILTSATGRTPSGETPPSAAPQGTSSAPIGTACTPSQELSVTFAGFDYHEVTLDENNAACGGDVCLVNHFQGLTSCPYGQKQDAGAAPGACTVPGSDAPVTGQEVQPECVDRQASAAVVCSCRCANTAGKTNDGAIYCTCPSDYSCTQVVPAAQSGDPRAGAYCIKNGTVYDRNSVCLSTCSETLSNCP